MFDKATILYHFLRTKYLESSIKYREQLESWQKKRLEHFKRSVLAKSSFYHQYLDRPLSDFPIMNKQLMMENFDQLNTVGVSKDQALDIALTAEKSRNFSPMIKDITIGLSSGTSGHRGIFLVSHREQMLWAGIMLAKALPGSIMASHKIAFFLRANSNLYTNLTTHGRFQFVFFDLTKPLNLHLHNLHDYQPTILVAPSSVLKVIAQAQDRGEINVHPQKIIAVAEVLDPFDQSFISSVFKQPVHQIYQATEGFLGITDADTHLRLNEEFIHVEKEWIDQASGRFVPIITDFTRSSQPIVRYRLDDVLIMDKSKQQAPYVYLKTIEGRCDDVCYLSAEGKLMPLFPDALRQVLSISAFPVQDYRFVQTSTNHFMLQLAPYPNLEQQEHLRSIFVSLCNSLMGLSPEIVFTEYQRHEPHHKLKRIERRFQLQEKI